MKRTPLADLCLVVTAPAVMRLRHLRHFAACLLAMLALGCSEGTPIQPDQASLSSADGEVPTHAVFSIGLTASELLADPLLHDMLEALGDERGASKIIDAVNATYESLTQDDIKTARRHLDGAYRALDQYVGRNDVSDEDVIHLDASEWFLDEVEAMIYSDE